MPRMTAATATDADADADVRTGPPPWDPWRAATVALGVVTAPRLDAAALARLQDRRLRELLSAAARGSAFWRERLRGRDLATLRLADIPTCHKGELMARFDDWVADPALHLDGLRRFMASPGRIARAYLGRYAVWESSGSAGEPAVFVQDAAALSVYDALESLRRPGCFSPARAWWGALAGDTMAFVGAVDGHFASTVSIERLRALNPWMARRIQGLSFLLPPDELAARLQALAPTVLATYPSMAVLLAEAQAAGRLAIAPQEVWTGGETLRPAARARIEQAFGARVLDSYGCSECLALASECVHGRLHLNADWAILESVDRDGRPVPPGTAGERTLLTNLANHVQPVLRYELGDQVVFDPGPCPCGSSLPVLHVEGRVDESLDLSDGRGGRVRLSPLALCTVLEDEAGLYQFQLVQVGERALSLTATDGARLRPAARALKAFLATQGGAGIEVRADAGPPAVHGRSGKLPRVVGRAAAPRRR